MTTNLETHGSKSGASPVERRPYQDEAVAKIVDRGSLLLATTMGSGKTRIAIDAIAESGPDLCGVVFCTKSLKYQWAAEIEKWFPEATYRVVDGHKTQRRKQYEADPANFTILSYDYLVPDWDVMKEYLPIDFIIGDEITAVKSFTAKRSRRLKAIGKHSPIRIGMSGQPVENRPEELFSIMEFVDPAVLGNFHVFDRAFIVRDSWGKPVSYRNLDTLHDHLSEAMFRRSRADIEEYLPERQELDVPVDLDDKTLGVYKVVTEDLLACIDDALEAGMSGSFDLQSHYGKAEEKNQFNKMKGEVMSRMTALRLMCDHPRLLELSANRYNSHEESGGSEYVSWMMEEGMLSGLPKSSAKLDFLMEMIEGLYEDPDTKTVVFSGFKSMVKIIGEELKARDIGFTSMTGDTSAKERNRRIELFQENPDVAVFLSSDAGAYGVNLDKGTHLINFDLPWSSGQLDQRVSRIDRTSTAHSHIDIVYMYSRGTVEEWQYAMLKQKSAIAAAFVDGKGFGAKGTLDLSLESLRSFLLNGET